MKMWFDPPQIARCRKIARGFGFEKTWIQISATKGDNCYVDESHGKVLTPPENDPQQKKIYIGLNTPR